ncbi:Hypothetical predicted protein [Olea europaea subsp. europaea]|uniref:AT3G52170-like helix-turn-helix domain-containing protein n=1 Tax=Olea europaea subsp. europaea TaxID=158383 RepID=A0A8S0SWE3_OLEEU|nr:Hypothetical predicted protein [Olea europaea subsp. europaea]
MNAGKFPTASDARKEVGGSYYTIRQILQELEYNSKMSPIDIREATSKVNDTMKKNTSEEGMETSFSALDKSEGVAAHTHHLPLEAKCNWHSHREKPVNDTNDDTVSEDMLKFVGLRAKTEQQPSPDLGNSGRELYKEPTGDAESQGKSSVWKNLKSLVNNIIVGRRKF